MRHLSEDELDDYRREAAGERYRAHLERLALLRGPDAAEPCEWCAGRGIESVIDDDAYTLERECPRCLGSGVKDDR